MKTPITEEEIKDFEVEYSRRQEFLFNHGWLLLDKEITEPQKCKIKVWHDPVKNQTYPYDEGYDQLTMILLKDHGWKAILEIVHMGSNGAIAGTWGRFQSPFTNRVYSFLEAQYIMEQNWSEEEYPKNFSESTVLRNQLIGNTFQEKSIATWYFMENKKLVVRYWVDDIIS